MASTTVRTARTASTTPVKRLTRRAGMRCTRPLPTVRASADTDHSASRAPVPTLSGSRYRAARLAVVIWVMSPHSPRKTTPKEARATRTGRWSATARDASAASGSSSLPNSSRADPPASGDATEHRQRPEAGPEHERGEQRLVRKLGREDHHERGQDNGEVHRLTVTNPTRPRWRGRTQHHPERTSRCGPASPPSPSPPSCSSPRGPAPPWPAPAQETAAPPSANGITVGWGRAVATGPAGRVPTQTTTTAKL